VALVITCKHDTTCPPYPMSTANPHTEIPIRVCESVLHDFLPQSQNSINSLVGSAVSNDFSRRSTQNSILGKFRDLAKTTMTPRQSPPVWVMGSQPARHVGPRPDGDSTLFANTDRPHNKHHAERQGRPTHKRRPVQNGGRHRLPVDTLRHKDRPLAHRQSGTRERQHHRPRQHPTRLTMPC